MQLCLIATWLDIAMLPQHLAGPALGAELLSPLASAQT